MVNSIEIYERVANTPFNVGLMPFKTFSQAIPILGDLLTRKEGPITDVLAGGEIKRIDPDELALSPSQLEGFRSASLSFIGRLIKKDASALQPPDPVHADNLDYLRPLFNGKSIGLEADLFASLNLIQQAMLPVPHDFVVFLPEDEKRQDEVLRNLIPFKKTQRVALKAAWSGEATAFRVTYGRHKAAAFTL